MEAMGRLMLGTWLFSVLPIILLNVPGDFSQPGFDNISSSLHRRALTDVMVLVNTGACR